MPEKPVSRVALRPYLISKQEAGGYRIVIRTTRFNSQGYPLVSAKELDDAFPTATAARAYLREHYRAETTDIATK